MRFLLWDSGEFRLLMMLFIDFEEVVLKLILFNYGFFWIEFVIFLGWIFMLEFNIWVIICFFNIVDVSFFEWC